MENDPQPHHRRSVRLQGYDYSQQGAYFVTVCCEQRYLHFDDERIRGIAETCWLAIPEHFPIVELDEWVLMPNHLHGIVVIHETGKGVQLNAPTKPSVSRNPSSKFSAISPYTNTLSVIIRTYKAAVTSQCRQNNLIEFAWQRSFHDHIIRDERDLNRIHQYILDNPTKWLDDEYYYSSQ